MGVGDGVKAKNVFFRKGDVWNMIATQTSLKEIAFA